MSLAFGIYSARAERNIFNYFAVKEPIIPYCQGYECVLNISQSDAFGTNHEQ